MYIYMQDMKFLGLMHLLEQLYTDANDDDNDNNDNNDDDNDNDTNNDDNDT